MFVSFSGGFKTEAFVAKHKLGSPVAGNFYQGEFKKNEEEG